MHRYYFDVTEADHHIRDDFGADFADDHGARTEAIALLPLLLRDATPSGDAYEVAIIVRDGQGKAIYEASLALNGRWWPGRR